MTRVRSGRPTPRTSSRSLHARVKTAKGRKTSSTRWLQRQLNDPYVAEAKRLGYRSRAAFKLLDLDDRFHVFGPGKTVVDLGAAPGGWTQVAVERTGAVGQETPGRVIAIDVNDMAPVPGATFMRGDILDPAVIQTAVELAGRAVDVVLSDMAAPATGHAQTDHLRIMALLEAALDLALTVLAPGGAFVGKVLQGGSERSILRLMQRHFKTVRHAKPPSSRKDSAELYVVAMEFREDSNP